MVSSLKAPLTANRQTVSSLADLRLHLVLAHLAYAYATGSLEEAFTGRL